MKGNLTSYVLMTKSPNRVLSPLFSVASHLAESERILLQELKTLGFLGKNKRMISNGSSKNIAYLASSRCIAYLALDRRSILLFILSLVVKKDD